MKVLINLLVTVVVFTILFLNGGYIFNMVFNADRRKIYKINRGVLVKKLSNVL